MYVYQNSQKVDIERFNADLFLSAKLLIYSAKEYFVDFEYYPRALDLRFIDISRNTLVSDNLGFYLIGENVRYFKRDMEVTNSSRLSGRGVFCFFDRSRERIEAISPN